MSDRGELTGDADLDADLALLDEVTARLSTRDLGALVRLAGPSAGLCAAGRKVETSRRRLAGFDAAYVAALEAGGEPARYGCTSTAVFLGEQLRLSRREAKARVALARSCTPRAGFSGLPLPAAAPVVATAIAAGDVSAEQAGVILSVLERLPEPIREAHGPVVEAEMVEAAGLVEPGRLAALGRAVIERADPDGVLRDMDYRRGQRSGTVFRRAKGAGRLVVDFDDEGFEVFTAALDPLTAPVPTGPDGPDPRTPGQRVHDAVVDLARRALNSGDLPASGGTPTSLVIHVDADQLAKARDESGRLRSAEQGWAWTETGGRLPLEAALTLADQAVIYLLFETSTRVPLELFRTSRLASSGQTIALAARDRGCSFPGCDRPPGWCQRHHVREWLVDHGPTNVDNLTLVCGFHHREFAQRGWRVDIVDGLPWWTPPAWIDPDQAPIRNAAHGHAR